MMKIPKRSGNLVALKTEKNQVTIYDLKNLDNEKVIECESSINAFTINDKDNFVAIILENHDIILYDLTLQRIIEHHNQIKYFPFQIIFIHLGALWLGDFTKSNTDLLFNIQQINDFSQINCSIKTTEFSNSTISNYHMNRDMLLCVFKGNEPINKIVHYQLLDSRDIKQRKCFEIQTERIEMIQSNWNNTLIVFITETGLITLIDDDRIIEYKLSSQLPVKSIDFDIDHNFSFCLATNKTYHFCFYSSEKSQCFRYDSCAVSNDDSLMVAYKLPCLYLFKENTISLIKNKHLKSYQQYKQEVENMISAECNQFKKHLYDCKIDDPNLWRIIAKKCAIDRDIDSVFICAAKMGEAGLVRSLKREMATNGKHVALFLWMLHLDLVEESEELLKEIDPDQRVKLYSLQEKWNIAFECVNKIELKNLYYQYGKQMEMENKILDAIIYYEQSGHISQIIRMLFESENISDLKNYCLKKQPDGQLNKYLVSWWGQYCESQGDHESAMEMYKMANDFYNLVRILCHIGRVEEAIEFVDSNLNSSGSVKSMDNQERSPEMTAAILFLGKHLESIDSVQSIEYYLQCCAIRHALRVCVAHEHFDKMVDIAVQYSSPNEATNILNTYFPDPNDFHNKGINEENMAMLYYKAEQIKKAIHFSIKYRLWNFLRNILLQQLENDQRNFLVEQEEIDIALNCLKEDSTIVDIVIDLILISNQKNFDLITEIIHQYGIDVNDSLMTKLETFVSKHQNKILMNTIAELCLEKGNYQLAAKLYNNIGKRIDSIKALIRTGQEDKIIQFANVARNKTVFKLAANFLQTINYADSDLVIKFYTKADAQEELARYRNNVNIHQSE